MRIPVPDVIPPADGARPGALRRHRRGRAVRDRPDHGAAGRPGHRQRRPRTRRSCRPARARRAAATSATTPSTSATPTRSWSPPPPATTTRRCVEARARGLRILPRSAGLKSVMAGRRRGRRGRHPRQDHDHLDAHHGAAAPPARTRRTRSAGCSPRPGRNADAGSGDLFVAEADESDGAFLVYRPARRAGHQRRRRPPRRLGHARRPTARPSRSSSATIDPRRLPGRVRRRPRCRARCRSRARERDLIVVTVGRSPTDGRAAEPSTWPARRLDLRASSHGGRGLGTVTPADARAALRARRRSPPWRSACASAIAFADLRARARGVHRHRPPDGAQGRGRRRAGLRQLRPPPGRDRRRPARPPARSPGTAGVVVAFQPHLVSRTRIFGAAMGAALGAADEVVVLDVYVAREDPDPAVTGAPGGGRRTPAAGAGALRAPTWPTSPAELVRLARPGDLVLTLGAGSVTERRAAGAGPARERRERRAVITPAAQPAQGERAAATRRPRRAAGSPGASGCAAGWSGAT